MIGNFTPPRNKSATALVVNALTWLGSGGNPAMGTGGTIRNAYWSRIGELMWLRAELKTGAVGAGAGAGTFYVEVKIPNPAGGYFYVDVDKIMAVDNRGYTTPIGLGGYVDNGASTYQALPALYSAGDSTNGFQLTLNFINCAGTYPVPTAWTAAIPVAAGNGDIADWNCFLPIVGWAP